MAGKRIRNQKTIDIGMLNEFIDFQKQVTINDSSIGVTPAFVPWKPRIRTWKTNSPGNSYNQQGQKADWYDRVTFYIQMNRDIFTTPVTDFRIIYTEPNSKQKSVYSVESIDRVSDSNFFLAIRCTGNEMESPDAT